MLLIVKTIWFWVVEDKKQQSPEKCYIFPEWAV